MLNNVVRIFAEVCFVYEILRMQGTCINFVVTSACDRKDGNII